MNKEVQIKPFKKVLVANRGEIAIRVFRALNELGITTVSIYSREDRYALFRSKADESYQLDTRKGPIDAYLDIDTIIKIALAAKSRIRFSLREPRICGRVRAKRHCVYWAFQPDHERHGG